MRKCAGALAALALVFAIGPAATGAGGPTQSDAAFEASYAGHVTNVSATTQATSCYRPELYYDGQLPANAGYPGGGSSPCPAVAPAGAPFTGEDRGLHYDTQDQAGKDNPVLLVKEIGRASCRERVSFLV